VFVVEMPVNTTTVEDLYEHLSTSELLLCPPPAPRKIYVHKKINVSSRVRRRLNFDDMGDDDVVAATPKKMRLAPAAELMLTRPISIITDTSGASSDGELSDTSVPSPTGPSVEKTPTTNKFMNKLSLKFDDCTGDGLLLVDDGGFTTPDKCVCKSANMPVKVKPSFKRPLRL
jgi:hypothetical protein